MDPMWTAAAHALTLIAFVSYFAALFFTLRVFVYHREALARWEPDRTVLTKQYTLMTHRIWNFIAWPSLVLLVICGLLAVFQVPGLLTLPWVQALLGLGALLVVYHFANQRIRGRLERHEPVWSAFRLRIWSQGATLLLAAFAVVLTLRDLKWYYGVLGLVVLGAVLVLVLGVGKKKTEADAANGKPGA
ncbi:MAG TPA: CopD family protein [Flavobacteriales bacterium]|nr:CopD family protein [Flavobacteriales bacterium]